MLKISEDLLPSRPVKEAGVTDLSFDGLLEPPLKLHEDLKEGCGGQLWPAGVILARYLLSRLSTLQGRTMFCANPIPVVLVIFPPRCPIGPAYLLLTLPPEAIQNQHPLLALVIC